MIITSSSTIEEIVATSTDFVDYLSKQGIRCIRCGEPIWGTLEEAASQKGFSKVEIQRFVKEMNEMLAGKPE